MSASPRRRERRLKDHGNAIRELKKARIGDSLDSLSPDNQSGAGRSERGQPTV